MAAARPPPPEAHLATIHQLEDEAVWAKHFRTHGFVVIGGVLGSDEIEASVEEVWSSPSLLGGHPSIQRDDPASWGAWPAGDRNFLDPIEPFEGALSWQNRMSASIARVFEVLWLGAEGEGPPAEGRLVVSVDRFGIMRPTRGDVERPEWRTSCNWLHWDQNPWVQPSFSAMQGLLALSGTAESGGFVTVPGFHREFADWAAKHPEGSVARCTRDTVPFPVPLGDEIQSRRKKVFVPPGGLLVWDSRMPHENYPNSDGSFRIVQYVTYKRLSWELLRLRSAAWQSALRTGLAPAGFARRFSADEQARLGMAVPDDQTLGQAISNGESLSAEELEAVQKFRRAYRLKQTAMMPDELREARDLFRESFLANPYLKELLQRVAAAEASYLPFWIL